jgi:hypothetical protein
MRWGSIAAVSRSFHAFVCVGILARHKAFFMPVGSLSLGVVVMNLRRLSKEMLPVAPSLLELTVDLLMQNVPFDMKLFANFDIERTMASKGP